MTTVLDVVNECLATLGEAPLNTMLEPHVFRGTAQRTLAKASKEIQSKGWWFNTEAATLSPATNGEVYLPADCLKWQSGVRTADMLVRGQPKPWLVQRGQRLYDTRTQSYAITEDVAGELVREVPFTDLPPVISAYIASYTVLQFQVNFDADRAREERLVQRVALTRAEANAENTRQLGVNLLNNNARLSRIRATTRRVRGGW